MKTYGTAITALCICFSAISQDAASLDGTWLAKFPAPSTAFNKGSREAKLVIANGAGTFQLSFKAREDPCIGREFPITISNVSTEGFDIDVQASKVLAGCQNFTWKPKRAEGGGYEGTFPDGRKFVLIRAQ